MFDRKDKHFRLGRSLVADFKRSASLLGFSEAQAAEIALAEWVKKNHDEVQKKLDLYAEKGIVIKDPGVVNIAVFQKAEILLAKEEITRLLGNLERGNPDYRREMQLQLAQALKRIQPVYSKSKDPELLKLLEDVEAKLK
jgi:hypothetical protein